MRRAAVLFVLVSLVLAPTAQGASLSEELDDIRFNEFVFTFTWNTDSDRANVLVDAKDLTLEGEAAAQLRSCIDGGDCVVPALSQAARDSETDGEVTEEEVDSFGFYVQAGLMTLDEMKKIKADLQRMVKIDNLAATQLQFTDLRIVNAEGSVGSTDEIKITIHLIGSFGTVAPADHHEIWVQRRQTNFTVADQLIVQAGKGWRIAEGSIKPDSAAALFDKGKFSGSQDEFESTEPLQFTLEKHKKSPGWGLMGAVAALGVAALLTAFFVIRRRKL